MKEGTCQAEIDERLRDLEARQCAEADVFLSESTREAPTATSSAAGASTTKAGFCVHNLF